MTKRLTGGGLTLLLSLLPAHASTAAQGEDMPGAESSSVTPRAALLSVTPVDPQMIPSDRTSERNDLVFRNAAVIGGGILVVGYYGLTQWWQDGFAGQFRTMKEGWFGQGTEQGGADKLGHSYFSYVNARLMTRGFEAVGNSPAQARSLGAWSALGVMMGVEVLDGFSKKYRFSGEDAVMNLAGVGLAVAMETWPSLDRKLDYRLLYKPSPGSSFEPGGDYSGQTYLLVLKANGFSAWREHPVLRYVELAAGYGARGYGESPAADPHRNTYVGISLNLSELLGRTVFRKRTSPGGVQRATDIFLDLVQVPGTIVLKGHRL